MAANGRAENCRHASRGAATSRVFLRPHSSGSIANSEPIAPPVMMIGPSAPNGPPLPIEIAEETGFRIATALAVENGLNRLGNAVAPDLFRSEAGHQANDQAPHDGNSIVPHPSAASGDLGGRHREPAEPEQIGGDSDQPEQPHAHMRRPCPTASARAASSSMRRSALWSARR